jgi:hypothetical protein
MIAHAHYREISAATPYDMGLALGRAFGPALRPFLEKLPPPPRQAAQDYLKRCFEFTRHEFPDITAEIEGYAAGAGVGLDIFWRMLLEDDLQAISDSFGPQEKCTSFVAGGGRVIGHNEDWDAESHERLWVLRRNCAGRVLFELHYAGTPGGNALSINGAGIVQMINSQDSEPVDMSVPRVPANVVARFVAEAEDIDATLVRLKKLPRMGGYAHTLVRAAECRLIETSQSAIVSCSVASFPYAHANHYVLEEMCGRNTRPPDRAANTRRRMETALTGAKAVRTPAEARALLEDASGGPDCGLMNARTLAGVVVDLEARQAWVRLASEPEKSWLRYELDFLPVAMEAPVLSASGA